MHACIKNTFKSPDRVANQRPMPSNPEGSPLIKTANITGLFLINNISCKMVIVIQINLMFIKYMNRHV